MEPEVKTNTRPRLWVVSEVYYPEETSTGYYMTSIAEGVADRFDVRVLCGQPNYSIRGTTAPKREIRNGTQIFRVAGTRLNRNVIAFRLINMLTLGASVFLNALLRFRRGDRVLVVTTPPNVPFIVAAAALLRGANYTLLIHDSYPEILIAVRKLKPASAVVRCIDYLNRWLYKHTRKIVVVGRDMKELVNAKSQGFDTRVTLIPNWAETDDVQPRPRNENALIHELGIENSLVVLHAGNIGYPTDVETFIDCVKEMNGDKRFHFVFIGSGVKKPVLEKAKDSAAIANLTLLDPRPRGDQIDFLNACDVGLVSLIDNMLGAAMPSKAYNIMAAGKPILAIADDRSELAQMIDEEDIGWHVRPGDSSRLIEILNDIFENRDRLPVIGARARKAAEEKYSLAVAIAKYEEELS